MAKQYGIPVIVRTQDNGDGGYTTRVYNNEAELLADHPMAEDGVLTEEQKQEILSEENPYENGYISRDNIAIEIGDDGVARLVGVASFHAGQ